MSSQFCPQCGTPRLGNFRFCRSCRFDYDSEASIAAAATGTEASANAAPGEIAPSDGPPANPTILSGPAAMSGGSRALLPTVPPSVPRATADPVTTVPAARGELTRSAPQTSSVIPSVQAASAYPPTAAVPAATVESGPSVRGSRTFTKRRVAGGTVAALVVLGAIGSAVAQNRGSTIAQPSSALLAAQSTPTARAQTVTPAPPTPAPTPTPLATPRPTVAPTPRPTVAPTPVPVSYATLSSRSWSKLVKAPDDYIGEGYVLWACMAQFDAATETDSFRAELRTTS